MLDEEPDGRAWNLMSPTVAVLRARYRNDERHPELMVPGRPYELVLRLPITSNCFLRGHRLRVHLMSSFFPHLDRNPNTGRPVPAEGQFVVARQTVFHDARWPSRVILPVVPSIAASRPSNHGKGRAEASARIRTTSHAYDDGADG